MKRAGLMGITTLLIVALLPQMGMAQDEWVPKSKPGTQTTLIIVRHAEKDQGSDPPLTLKGEIRAEYLKDALIQSNVSAIFTPDLKRNRQTAWPLAEALDIKPIRISPEEFKDPKSMARHVVETVLEKYSGQTVLWIGNQSTKVMGQLGNLQEIYWLLGGENFPMTRYNNMYIFTITESGPAGIIKTLYGDPSDS